MCWELTKVNAGPDTGCFFVQKTPNGPGIGDNGDSTTWSVPVETISAMALDKGMSPFALAAGQIRNYILEYYYG